MTYVPATDRYDRMQYRRSGRSGLQLPAVSLGLWHNFGHDRPYRARPRDRAPRLRPRHPPLRPREQLRAAVRLRGRELRPDPERRPPPLPRRADHLDQGRLRHVAWPVRRVGLAQVPAREPRPVAGADGPRVRRPLLLAPLRSGDPARGDDRRARHRCAPGQGALRRHLVLLGREDAGSSRDRARPGDADRDPPAVLLHAQPLDRAGAARHARGRGHRLHRLLAARAGDAHRPLSRRHPATRGPRARARRSIPNG